MRKIWRKLLAAALVGVLAGNVACKDYDDDINAINKRVETLEGSVALKTDMQQLQATVDKLNNIDFSAFLKTADFEAQLQRAGVAYKSDLKAWLTSDDVKALIAGYGYQTAADVQQLIDGLQNAGQVEETFNAMIAAYDLWGKLQGDVTDAIDAALGNAPFMTGESALSQGQIDQLLTVFAQAFGAEGKDVKSAIDGWLGEGFADYMAAYEPTEAFIAKLGIGDASIAAVKGALTDTNSGLVAEINKIIAKATDGNVSNETLKPVFEAYDKKIEALEIRVAEIEGRIQSLVWVPSTQAEITTRTIDLGGRVTVDLAKGEDSKTVVLNESVKVLTWKVTPASACRKIEPAHVSLDVQSVKTRAAAEPVRISDVKIDAEKGTISVTLSTDEDLIAMENEEGKLPAVALHVVVPGVQVEGEETPRQGIDFLSDYTMVKANPTQELEAADFRIVRGEQVAVDGELRKELDYTDGTAQTFLDGLFVAVEQEKAKAAAYADVTEYWEAFGEEGVLKVVCTPETDDEKKPVVATVSDEALKPFLTLGADGFSIKKNDPSLRGATVASGLYTYSIEGVEGSDYEGYALELGTVRMAYEIVTTTVEMKLPAVAYAWTYAAFKNNKLYSSEKMSVTGLTVEQYNEAKASNFDLKLYAGEKEVSATVTLAFTTTPSAETDAKWAVLEIRDLENGFAEGGDFAVKGSCELEACRVKVEVPVSVKGMPELTGIEIPAATFTFDGTYDYELVSAEADYMAQLWNANKAAVAGQITEKEFGEIIAGSTVESKADGKAALVVADDAVQVRFEAAALNEEKSYAPSIEYTHESGLKTSVKVRGVKLVKPALTWIPNALYVVNGRAAMKTTLEGNSFRIEEKDMSIAYATKEGYDIAYSIYDAPKSAQAEALAALAEKGRTLPTIGNGVLAWNDWSALELVVKAEASKNGVVIGETKFFAYIEDPVGALTVDEKADLTLTAGASKRIASLVNLPAGKRDCFTAEGLDAELAEALKGKVKYEKVGEWNSAVTLDAATGTVSVADSSIAIAAEVDVTVKVTYEYQFGSKSNNVTLKVKKD